jgi:hypothetical protein
MNNLVRMVYVSTSTNTIPETHGNIPKEVGRILMQSRRNNPQREIGGVLYFSNNFFFQCLEGEQEQVERVYNKISADPRHNRIQTLSLKRIDERLFSDWSMKYVALDHQVGRILAQHGKNEFNPYEFNEEMIDKMLGLFMDANDKTGRPDQNYGQRPGLLSRLFGRKKAA